MPRSLRAMAAAPLLLLLSSGPFCLARGSVLSHGDKTCKEHSAPGPSQYFTYQVPYDGGIEADHRRNEHIEPVTRKRKDLVSTSAGAPAGLPFRQETHADILADSHVPFSKMVLSSAINSRNLQEADCADGTSSISVTSTVFPLLEGCLVPGFVDGDLRYETETAIILAQRRTSSTDPIRWYAFYLKSVVEYTLACGSLESVDDVDPSEATWYCDADGDGHNFELADEELVVSCGCAISSPSPAAIAPTTSPAVVSSTASYFTPAATSRTLNSTPACGEGDSFSIVSDTFPEAEGCFLSTTATNNGNLMYTISGTTDVEQVFVVAMEVVADDPSSIVWAVANYASSDGLQVYCTSVAEASLYHPADVPVWQCDTDGDGVRETTEDVLSMSCGCATTPTPEPGVTPAPALSPPTSTCSGQEDSFSISSEGLPDTEGCYLYTGYTYNDIPIFTASGTPDGGELWMAAFEYIPDDDGDPEFVWALVYVMPTSSTAVDNITYCYSVVEAAFYHPSEVPEWICDPDAMISVDCGCSGSPSPETPSPEPPSPTARPAAPPLSPPTPAPAAPVPMPVARTPSPVTAVDDDSTTSVSNTCTGDGDFTITANAAPPLDGCYKDTGNTEVLIYSVSGEVTVSEIWVFSFVDDDTGDFNWYIVDVPISDNGDILDDHWRYCVSVESASIVNPGSASWNCDFFGNGDMLANDNDISITCGACLETEAVPPNTASKLLVGVVTAVCAGVVAAASAFGYW